MMNSFSARPIFIVSSPRSGSTLLRLVLDAHPRLAFPPPGWLFHFIFPYLYSYGDLNQGNNFQELVEDILNCPTIKRWPIELNVEQVLSEARDKSFRGVYEYLHEIYARNQGKSRWGEKTPRNSVWIDEIKSLFPDAQFIHLIRDGRDVAIDISDADFLPGSVIAGARIWRNFVRAIRRSQKSLGPDSFYEIYYEKLCRDPGQELKKLCDFLGEEYSSQILAYHQSDSAQNWSTDPRHAKTSRPITSDFVDMYKSRLHDSDLAPLNALLGDALRSFNYPVEGHSKPLPEKEALQFFEHDTITTSDSVDYKKWHRDRRVERRNRGVYGELRIRPILRECTRAYLF